METEIIIQINKKNYVIIFDTIRLLLENQNVFNETLFVFK